MDVVPQAYRKEKCPIIDTWWQTETGMHLIAPLPVTPLKPGSVTKPLPGIEADVVDEKGEPVPLGKGGFLVIRKPWPAMFRTLFNDEERYIDVYWNQIPGGVYTQVTWQGRMRMDTSGSREDQMTS